MLILLLLGVTMAWYIQHKIYQRQWAKGLQVNIQFQDTSVYEGDSTVLREEIINDKHLPIPALEVRFTTSRNLEIAGEAGKNVTVSDQNYQRDVFSMWGRQKVIRRMAVSCRKRGVYEINRCEVVGYNLFYHSSYPREQEQQTQLYVYPRQVDVRRIRMLCQSLSGTVLARCRVNPDPFEFSGIREYQRTDPMNSINWKSSARNQGLMVNQYDSTTKIQVTVILDVEDSGIYKYEELVEESIGIASSLAAVLVGNGMELNVVGNMRMNTTGYADGGGKYSTVEYKKSCEISAAMGQHGWGHMYIKPGTGQMQELNRRLAEISLQDPVNPINQTLEQLEKENDTQRTYVLISKNHQEKTLQAVQNLAADGTSVLWVIPYHNYMNPEFPKADRVSCIPWEVA